MSKRSMSGDARVMGADETIVKARGKAKLVGFVADAESGELLGIDMLVERDSDGFANRIKGYVDCLGVKAVVTDDLSTYKPVVDNWAWSVKYALRMRVRTRRGVFAR